MRSKGCKVVFFINSDHAAIGLFFFPELDNIYKIFVYNKRPKKIGDISTFDSALKKELRKIDDFEKVAPVLYGCILLRAKQYWLSLVPNAPEIPMFF